jgi:hypothetical protein
MLRVVKKYIKKLRVVVCASGQTDVLTSPAAALPGVWLLLAAAGGCGRLRAEAHGAC